MVAIGMHGEFHGGVVGPRVCPPPNPHQELLLTTFRIIYTQDELGRAVS